MECENGVTAPLFTQGEVLIQGVPQALEVLLQAWISLHLCRKPRPVPAQCRYAHPAKLPADLCKTLLARKGQAESSSAFLRAKEGR
jgi:hypothetical protein